MQREGSLFSQLVSNENISLDAFCRGHLSHSTRVCGDGGPCVINKEHRTLQTFYRGEEGNQKHLEELCIMVVDSSRQTQVKNWGWVWMGGTGGAKDATLPVTDKTATQ